MKQKSLQNNVKSGKGSMNQIYRKTSYQVRKQKNFGGQHCLTQREVINVQAKRKLRRKKEGESPKQKKMCGNLLRRISISHFHL